MKQADSCANGAASVRIRVTTFRHYKTSKPQHAHGATWAAFVEELKSAGHVELADKHDGELFGLYALKEGTTRAIKNVDAVHGWALDLDCASQEQIAETFERLSTAGLAFVAYSTHSHTDERWKLRVLGPLAEPVPGKDWPAVWRAIVDKFAPWTDEQCKDVCRIYFWPSHPPGQDPIFFSEDGEPLDVSTLDVKPAAAPTVDLNAKELLSDGGARVERCPVGRTAFEHAEHLCKVLPPAISGKGGHIALLRVARALRWGLELDSETTAKLLAELYNPRCDPPWTETELAHKVEAAEQEDGAAYRRGALLVHAGPSDDVVPLDDAMLDGMAQQHHTDSGNAERFALMFGERVRYCTPRKKWLIWNGKRWEWDERDQVFELAKQTARAMWKEIERHSPDDPERKQAIRNATYAESRQGLGNMIALAQPKCSVLPAELDSDPFAFNVQNGTIDLRTAELHPHCRDDLITKISPVEYDDAAHSDLWDQCLAKFTGNDAELASYMQRAIGYAMIGRVTEKHFWFGYGPPDGGKSTFLLAISAAFGDYQQSTDADTWLQRRDVGGNRGDVVRLLGTRLVTCSEIQKGARFDSKLIKKVTGGDALTAAAKYEGEVTFTPTFALWFAANDAPVIFEDDEGMWSRVRRLPFTNSIPRAEQDRTIQSRIQEPEHAAAVLAWAVAGCLAWQLDGLGTCAAVDRSSSDYRREMDRLAPFFEEHCTFEPQAQTPARALRDCYEQWCHVQRVRPVSTREFAAKLREHGCEDAQTGKERTRVWNGVRRVA